MSRSKNKGFLLLELMLTVTILTLGLILVVRSFITSLRAIEVSEKLFRASLLLEEEIWRKQEEKTQQDKITLETEQSGQFEPPFDNFSYKIEFVKEDELPLVDAIALYKTTFSVFWPQRKKMQGVSCVTYTLGKEE